MKRKFHAYCVGTGRSGTTSMAGIFSSCYRTAHQPHTKELLTLIPGLQAGSVSPEDFRKHVLYLDDQLQLEFNSSCLNAWQLDIFVSEFPDAKFIFTIRDCYSWLNSALNGRISALHAKGPDRWGTFLNKISSQGGSRYPKEERVLYENGLYTLDAFLSHWVKINNTILTAVPKSRMLVIKTHEIGSKVRKMADFLDVPLKSLDLTKSHMNKSTQQFNILSKIDGDYLSSKVNGHCKGLMDKFFPGFEDVRRYT